MTNTQAFDLCFRPPSPLQPSLLQQLCKARLCMVRPAHNEP